MATKISGMKYCSLVW